MQEKARTRLLQATIQLRDYSLNQEESYDLDNQTPWIQDILNDIESEIDPELKEDDLPPSTLTVHFEMLRKDNDELRDHLMIKGHFQASFQCHCVRCLKVMKQELDQDFAYCYLPPSLEDSEVFKDATDVYCDGGEMDLHFYDLKGKMNLNEIIYEQIQLNMEPLPLHSEDCKGLCGYCGVNLNKETCKHN